MTISRRSEDAAMEGRYQRFYLLPPNQHTPGAPLLISAGALLFDSQTGSVLAQLKLQNISSKAVKGLTALVNPLDTAGRALGAPVTQQYLDLYAKRDVMFGDQMPIRLPDDRTRGFSASITEVIFEDNSIWTAEPDAVWTPISEPTRLESVIADPELVKQYRLHFGPFARVVPERLGDLWRCTCWGINRSDEQVCHRCSLEAATLFPCNFDELIKEKDARLAYERAAYEAQLAAERIKAEERRVEIEARKAAKQKRAEKRRAASKARAKKFWEITRIVLIALVILAATILILTKIVIPKVKSNHAESEKDAGDYSEMISLYEPHEDYNIRQ